MQFAGERFGAFCRELEGQGVSAALVCDPRHVYYLTGFRPLPLRPAYLVVTAGQGRLVAPAGTQVEGLPVQEYLAYSIQELFPALPRSLEALARVRPGSRGPVGVEPQATSLAVARAALDGREPVDITPLLARLRLRKWPDEVELIRRGAELADAGYAAARQAAAAGGDEMAAYLASRHAVEGNAGEQVEFDGDFVSGERTLLHGGPPTGRRPQPGDTFILDLFPTYRGYWADTCRTLVMGEPTPAQQELARRVLAALEAGRQAIRPGLAAHELYRVLQQALGRGGDASSFSHHGGHGVGLSPHEPPMIVPADHTVLEAGMVVTLEPGLYLPGVGGMRFEDDYLVTDQGAQALSHYPLGLQPAGPLPLPRRSSPPAPFVE